MASGAGFLAPWLPTPYQSRWRLDEGRPFPACQRPFACRERANGAGCAQILSHNAKRLRHAWVPERNKILTDLKRVGA